MERATERRMVAVHKIRFPEDAERFSRDESRILPWGWDNMGCIWLLNADLDFPADALELLIQAFTGSEYDFVAEQVKMLDTQRWHSIRERYKRMASEHAKICKYPEANRWLQERNEQKEDLDQKNR